MMMDMIISGILYDACCTVVVSVRKSQNGDPVVPLSQYANEDAVRTLYSHFYLYIYIQICSVIWTWYAHTTLEMSTRSLILLQRGAVFSGESGTS